MIIRKYREEDAETISKLVCRNLLEVNSKDYGMEEMIKFAKEYNADKIRKIATNGSMYVACENEKIIGCGAISYNNQDKTESIILTFFILPEYHGKGVGKEIIKILEKDEIFLNSERVVVDASLSAHEFYKKMGYSYVKTEKKEDSKMDYNSNYKMEKLNKK